MMDWAYTPRSPNADSKAISPGEAILIMLQ